MNLKNNLLSEITQKISYCLIPFIWNCRKDKTTVTEVISVVAWGQGLESAWNAKGTETLECFYLSLQ